MVEPRLKSVVWERAGESLRMVYDLREQLQLTDPDGTVEELLGLLREGGRTVAGLAAALADAGRAVPVDEVAEAVAALDSYGLLEDGQQLGGLGGEEAERYFSNLAFFESFGSLARSREQLQAALRQASVLVLGTGGLSCNTIPHLAGLGVGRLTLLDHDAVDIRNFARQFLYRRADLGLRKVEVAAQWVREFDPSIEVMAIDQAVTGPDQVVDLLKLVGPDLVVSGIDTPAEVGDWVNRGCLAERVPYVSGGVYVTQAVVWSVQPGVSACLACSRGPGGAAPAGAAVGVGADRRGDEQVTRRLYGAKPPSNRAIGPAVGLLGSLTAWEVLRYLTHFEAPVYAGRPLLVDFADGCRTWQEQWSVNPACADCAAAGRAVSGRPPSHQTTGGGDPR